MIYLKKVTRKMNKYIENKNERKYKNLEAKTNVLKNIKNYLKKYLLTKQSNKLLK